MYPQTRSKRKEAENGHLHRGQAKNIKEDEAAIHEQTLLKLRAGARMRATASPIQGGEEQQPHHSHVHPPGVASAAAPAAAAPGSGRGAFGVPAHIRFGASASSARAATECSSAAIRPACAVCSNARPETPCSHCRKMMCDMCARMCDGCQDVFCSSCSLPNYEERYDRTFCIDCFGQLREERHVAAMESMDVGHHHS